MVGTLVRIGLAIACTVGGTAQAADTFDELLALTLRTHPAVEGRRAELGATQFDREGAEWQRYPSPSVEAATRSSGGNTGLFALEQPLWTGGRISAGIRAAGFREAAALAAVVEAKQSTALRLVAAYVEVLRQTRRQVYARAAVDEHERLLQLIERRVQQDVSPPADRDFARARLAQTSIDLSLANQGLQIARAQLAQLAGRPVQDIEDVRLEGRAIPAGEEEAVALAVQHSPVLARLEQAALAAAEDIDSRRAGMLPQLAMRLERQVGVLADSRAMLVLRAQPGAGLSAGSAVAAAQKRRDEAQLARLEAERALREQVQSAFVEWRASQVRMQSSRDSAGMSQAVFESYTRQYVTGRKTWIDVLNAVREVSQSQYLLADAEASARASALRVWLFAATGPLAEPSAAPMESAR